MRESSTDPRRISQSESHPQTAGGLAAERFSLAEALTLAWAAGIAAGGVYAITQIVKQSWLHRLAFVSREVLWMSPLAHLLLFIPLALVLAVVMRGRPVARAVVLGTLVFLVALVQVMPYTAIAWWAQLVLSVGVAVRVTTWYVRTLPRARPLVARATALATVLLLAAIGTQQGWRVAERRAQLAAMPVAADGAPNVLLIILDTVRGDNLSLYGYGRPTTPNLVRRAAESTVFDEAFATAPWTLPSHGSILTGRYPDDLPHDWLRPIAPPGTTLAERLRDRGYVTGGFVANLGYTSYETGLARGFLDYRDYPVAFRLVLKHSPLILSGVVQRLAHVRSMADVRRALPRVSLAPVGHAGWHPVRAREVSDGFLEWEAQHGARPYFAFLNYMNAHDPYRAPDSLVARFGNGLTFVDRYDAAIARLDEEVGRVLDTLERRGSLDRTIVVIAADHGELFGEHGLRGHAHALYRQLLQVPLLVRYPARVPRGTRVREAVSLRDIPATVLDLAGIDDAERQGRSLACTWTPESDGDPSTVVASVIQGRNVNARFPNARAKLWTVLDEDHQLIRNSLGEEQLFQYRVDPAQARNEVTDPEASDRAAQLRARLVSVTRRAGDHP